MLAHGLVSSALFIGDMYHDSFNEWDGNNYVIV